MARERTQYDIVGKHMAGKKIAYFQLRNLTSGQVTQLTKEQVCYLIGREQVRNCTAQVYKGDIILRGKGMSLDDLPTTKSSSEKSSRETTKMPVSSGTARRGRPSSRSGATIEIIGRIRKSGDIVGYKVNTPQGQKQVSRDQIVKLASQGQIINAKVQTYQGKPLLRGVNCNLNDLPVEDMGGAKASRSKSTSSTGRTTQKRVSNVNQAIDREIDRVNRMPGDDKIKAKLRDKLREINYYLIKDPSANIAAANYDFESIVANNSLLIDFQTKKGNFLATIILNRSGASMFVEKATKSGFERVRLEDCC